MEHQYINIRKLSKTNPDNTYQHNSTNIMTPNEEHLRSFAHPLALRLQVQRRTPRMLWMPCASNQRELILGVRMLRHGLQHVRRVEGAHKSASLRYVHLCAY